VKRDRK